MEYGYAHCTFFMYTLARVARITKNTVSTLLKWMIAREIGFDIAANGYVWQKILYFKVPIPISRYCQILGYIFVLFRSYSSWFFFFFKFKISVILVSILTSLFLWKWLVFWLMFLPKSAWLSQEIPMGEHC